MKNNFKEKNFLKGYFFKTKNKTLFTQLSLRILNLYLKSYIFCLHFILFLHVWIRIRIRNTDPDPEGSWNGSNMDPDPQHWVKP